MEIINVYWAAPLFCQAKRRWNRQCAEYLKSKGYYHIILPQDDARAFTGDDGNVDFAALAKHCREQAVRKDIHIMVAILDGSDADSGTSFEAGLRIESGGFVLGVRTDIRFSEDGHVNAMFRELTDILFFSGLNENYKELCDKIDRKIKEILGIESLS